MFWHTSKCLHRTYYIRVYKEWLRCCDILYWNKLFYINAATNQTFLFQYSTNRCLSIWFSINLARFLIIYIIYVNLCPINCYTHSHIIKYIEALYLSFIHMLLDKVIILLLISDSCSTTLVKWKLICLIWQDFMQKPNDKSNHEYTL